MIVMIDNYDSFTYNVVQYLAELGAELRVYRNDAITVEQIEKMKPKGLVLSPGPGRPEHAGIMNELIRSLSSRIPTLGVCLGHQGISQVFGATITYAPTLMHGKTSAIIHDGSRLYRNIPSPFVATRYHSLVVDRRTLGEQFRVSAWTADEVVMGIEHRDLPIYGVQYHPESILTTCGKDILRNFLEVTV